MKEILISKFGKYVRADPTTNYSQVLKSFPKVPDEYHRIPIKQSMDIDDIVRRIYKRYDHSDKWIKESAKDVMNYIGKMIDYFLKKEKWEL